MRIRRAEPRDATALADVFIASFGSLTFLPKLHTDDDHRAFVRQLLGRDEVWVAEEAASVVGFAALSGDMLEHLYVHPDAQRRGAGAALLAKVKAERRGGFSFWVFQQNAGARRFYEAHGCRVVRLTDGRRNEERTPDALYEWRPAGQATAGERERPR